LGVFRVLDGVPGFFGCSGMFRDVPGCSGVPVFRVPVFLKVLHAELRDSDSVLCTFMRLNRQVTKSSLAGI